MLPRILSCLGAAFLIVSVALSAQAQNARDPAEPLAPLNERVLDVPGDPARPVTLKVTVFMPPGPGPFPLAVMNHGAAGAKNPAQEQRYRHTFSAYYFLSRGYAVALPMMRGYAGSGGSIIRHGCDFAALGRDDAKDIRAVISYMARQPNIDASRIVVAGQSFGGWNTLAFGGLGMAGVRGLVSFSGGMAESDCPTPDASLVAAAGELGASAKAPSIWIFGDNDKLFKTSVWRAMLDHYRRAGGSAEIVAVGDFMTDSHQILSYPEGLPLWAPRVDAFLAKVGLPNRETHPEYMPMPPPKPSGFAAIGDFAAFPFSSDKARQFYQDFLARPFPRAIVVAANGSVAISSGGFDPLAAALINCGRGAPDCRPYAIDNDVVWTPPTPAPPPSRFATLANVDAPPFLAADGREGYRKFLALPKPRAFAIAPDGIWAGATGGYDPTARALAICGQRRKGCRLYAVNDDVVWTP